MRFSRSVCAALIVLAVALVPAWSAMAAGHSSRLYPSSDAVSASSAPVTVESPFGKITCTYGGGAFVVPAAGSVEALTTSFTTRPTLGECTKGWTVTTSGTWTLTTEYGTSDATINVPAEGLEFHNGGLLGFSTSPVALGGGWNNGFTSPVSVSSALAFGGTVSMWWTGFQYKPTPFSLAVVTLTDTTHPASLPVLGP